MRRRALLLPVLAIFLGSCEAWRLERQGRATCEGGLAIVRSRLPLAASPTLTSSEIDFLVSEFERAGVMIHDGLVLLNRASADPGGTSYQEIRPYLEALLVVRKKVAELKGRQWVRST